MGFNTTVVVMNDYLGDIGKDRDFGPRLADAIMGMGINQTEPGGLHVPGGAKVIETHHNDTDVIVAVGGNLGHVLGHSNGFSGYTEEGRLGMIRDLASQMGYEVVPKKKRKKG